MLPVLIGIAFVVAGYMLVHKIRVQRGDSGLLFGREMFQMFDRVSGMTLTPTPVEQPPPIAQGLDAPIPPAEAPAPEEPKPTKKKKEGKTKKSQKTKKTNKSKKGESTGGEGELQTANETESKADTGKKKTKKSKKGKKKKEKAAEAPM